MAYFKSIHIHFWVEYLSYLELIVFLQAKELGNKFESLINYSKEILFKLGNNDYDYVLSIVEENLKVIKKKK
jgi:Icc-related predicted phosphoesterase